MLRCTEQEVCNISYMHLKLKIKNKNWCCNKCGWTAADCEGMNVHIESTSENDKFRKTLFVRKSVAIGHNLVKNPYYDNLSSEQKRWMHQRFWGSFC